MTWSTVLAEAGYWAGGDLLRVPTSGTSRGAPRVVLRTVRSWTDSFDPFSEATGITADDVILAAGAPTSLLVYARAHAASVGARTLVDPRWDPRLLGGATVAHLTPTMLRDAVADEIHPLWEHTLRLAVVAGAALSPGLLARAVAHGLDVVEYYGAAELSFVAVGRGGLVPFTSVEVETRDDVIWVRSPWTALGYADGAVGPLRVAEGWCTVGDRGAVVDGALVVNGRPGVIVTGGTTVPAADVEVVLRDAPGVVECAVLGLPHARLGEVVAAVVVGGDRDEVVAHCRAALPREARPVLWFTAERMPTTGTGKTSLADLRRAVQAGEVARWR